MEVLFRWFSFSIGWFSGSILILRGVSRKSVNRSAMCQDPKIAEWRFSRNRNYTPAPIHKDSSLFLQAKKQFKNKDFAPLGSSALSAVWIEKAEYIRQVQFSCHAIFDKYYVDLYIKRLVDWYCSQFSVGFNIHVWHLRFAYVGPSTLCVVRFVFTTCSSGLPHSLDLFSLQIPPMLHKQQDHKRLGTYWFRLVVSTQTHCPQAQQVGIESTRHLKWDCFFHIQIPNWHSTESSTWC